MTPDLVRKLKEAIGDEEFVSATERCARSFPKYRDRLPLIPYAYTRTRLAKGSRYEVIVMQWAPGSVSAIHDHGNSRCWVLMLDGTLAIENFQRDDEPGGDPATIHETERFELNPGDLDHRAGALELHRARNPSDTSAFSLQLYVPPITHYTIVDAHSRHSRIVAATCDLELDY